MLKKSFWIIGFLVCFSLIFTTGASAATMSISASWNLVSSRITITVANTFADDTKFTSLWKWDATNSNWGVYLPGETDGGASYAQNKGFGELSTISPGEGFWVNSNSSQAVTITGTEQTNTDIALVSSWNLKGLVTSNSINVSTIFSDATKFASVWKWTGSSWAVYLPGEDTPGTYASSKGFDVLTTIAPGEGFWVNASSATTEVAEPPVIGGKVTYPESETSAGKIALYKAGLLAEIPVVEMPPTPGATVSVYAADDTDYSDPLATTTTDDGGYYSFSTSDFDDSSTEAVEMPPSVPVMVRAEFKSPINKLKKVAVAALVDPTDDEKKGMVEVNPLTHAIAEKIKTFVEDTFKIPVSQEIMTAAKTFIDLIATQMNDQGLTYFEEDDVVIGEFESVDSTVETIDFTLPPVQNLADKAIGKDTGGLFESMESALIEKAEADVTTLGTNAQLDETKKLEHFVRFFASLGFIVQAADQDETDGQKMIIFLPVPKFISDNLLPGVQMFNDRAFRMIDPSTDLTADYFTSIADYPGLIFKIRDALEGAPLLSSAAVQVIAAAAKAGKTTTLTKMAAVIKDKFAWKTEAVRMINGIPMFSGQVQTPKTGAEVSATGIICSISGQLGATPKAVAQDIASKGYYITDLADEVIHDKIHQIKNDATITDKKAAINAFFDSLQTKKDVIAMVKSSDVFRQEVKQISRRIYTAFPPDLYGQVLSASTQLKIKTSFVLMSMIIDRNYRIDPNRGWFKKITEGDKVRFEPNFANIKWLEPKEQVAGMASQIIGLLIGTEITDGADFATMVNVLFQTAANILEPDEFKMDATVIANVAGVSQNAQVTVTGILMNYDDTAMANMELTLKYFDTQGAIQDFAGGAVTTGDTGSFTFNNVPSGFPYEVRFKGNEFIFPFFVDGFETTLDLGGIYLPPPAGKGGPMGFPGVGLWVDQQFFNFTNPADANNGKLEGVDFSNFNTEKPFIVFQGSDKGTPDLFWTSVDGLTVNPTALAAGNPAKIASLGEGATLQYGLGSGPVVDHVFTKEELASTAQISMGGSTFTLSWVDSIATPAEDNAVYVVRDAEGKYFFIEVRWWDKDDENNATGGIDMGFAKLGSDGRLDVPKEDFIGGPAIPGLENVDFLFVDLFPGDYLDLDAGLVSPPMQDDFAYDATAVAEADIRWLGEFYDAYWADEEDEDTRIAFLSKSDRAISVTEGATLSIVTITTDDQGISTVTVEADADGVVKDVVPGTILLVETATKKHIVGVKWVENDAVGIMVIPKSALLGDTNALVAGIQDGDKDGIPNMFDDNDFVKDVFDAAWEQEQFKLEDADGDGVPVAYDPNDQDPNVPFANGGIDQDGDGLVGAVDPDDTNPNDPVPNGNWDEDDDGWPKAIDPDDNDNSVPAAGEEFLGGNKIVDADGDGIPFDVDPNDDPDTGGADNPIPGGATDGDQDGFPKGIEEWTQLGGQAGNDNDATVFPGSFKFEEATIEISETGTAKVAIVLLKSDILGAPPYRALKSLREITGLTLTGAAGNKYSIVNVTPVQIIQAINSLSAAYLSAIPAKGLFEILLIDDVDTENDGPKFNIYEGGDDIVGVVFEYELQKVDSVWQLNKKQPGGPVKVDDGTPVDLQFGPDY